MTKAEAEQEVIRRFHLLPEAEREDYDIAEAYAERLVLEIDFPSFTDRRRLIAAWIVREIARNGGKWEAYAA